MISPQAWEVTLDADQVAPQDILEVAGGGAGVGGSGIGVGPPPTHEA